MKLFFVFLLSFCALFGYAGETNTVKAINQPFTILFEHKLETNETFQIDIEKPDGSIVHFPNLSITNFNILKKTSDGVYTFSLDLKSPDKTSGFIKICVLATYDNKLSSKPSNKIEINVLNPIDGPRMHISKIDEFIVVYYDSKSELYEAQDLTKWVKLTNIYNPYIIEGNQASKKFWKSITIR